MQEPQPHFELLTTAVYPSISSGELGRLLLDNGYDAVPLPGTPPIGYRVLTQPRFRALLQTPFDRRPGDFGAIFLSAYTSLPAALSESVAQAVRSKTMFAHVLVNALGHLTASHTVVVVGGVTKYYLRDQLWYWKNDLEKICDEVRRQARAQAGATLH